MKKRLFLLIAAFLLNAVLLFGGGGKKGGSNEVNVPTMAGWAVMEEVKAHSDEFKNSTGFELKFHEYPHAEMMAKVIQEGQSGTGAFDVAMAGAINQAIIEPFLIPLDEYIERDFGSVEAFKKKFYPWAIDYGVYDGKVKYLQFHVNAEYCVYRKDLFEDPGEKERFEAEYGYPLAIPETPEQLVDVAKFFTRPEEEQWGFVIMAKGPPGGWAFISRIYGAGFKTADLATGKAPFTSGSDRAKAIDAVQWWADLIQEHKAMPPGTAAIAHRDTYEMFIGGRTAMSFGWWGDFYPRLAQPEVVSAIGESGSFVLPTQNSANGLPISTWGLGITKDAKNPEAAWEFIKFLLSEEVQLALSSKVGQGSPDIAYNEAAIARGWVGEAMSNELKRGSMPIRTQKGWDILNLYFQNASGVYSGEMTSEEFVDKIIRETEKTLK